MCVFVRFSNNLKITGLMKSDAGLFQCVATNAAGNVQAAASLAVTDGECV